MNHATAKIPDYDKTDDELIQQLCEQIQNTTTIEDGFTTIAALFESLDVTIERITLVHNGETSEVTINENASGVRRDIKGQCQNTQLTVVCINSITPNLNAILQSLVTFAVTTSQNWISLKKPTTATPASRMIGDSTQIRELSNEIARAARSNHSVLIKGESGSGKTTAAIMVHEQSPRSSKPFVDINCAAMPEALLESELFGYEKGAFTGAAGTKKGLFQIADGGTLFLDEIGEMKPELQAKLLTAIEQKKIRRLGSTKDVHCDVRIITASSRNIQNMIHEGTFREDLYYRIAVLEIQIAPLRDRATDIPALIYHRLSIEQQLTGRSAPYEIESLALKALTFYHWPGNIRELQNIISRLTACIDNHEPITQADVLSQLPQQTLDSPLESTSLILPPAARIINPDEDLHAFVARIQLLAIHSTIIETRNETRAATRLGYCRTGLLGLRRKLLRGQHRRAKTKSSAISGNQPSLPIGPIA